jgi:hypothetical protein
MRESDDLVMMPRPGRSKGTPLIELLRRTVLMAGVVEAGHGRAAPDSHVPVPCGGVLWQITPPE